MEPVVEEPSALLDEGSELLPLGEARALLYVAPCWGWEMPPRRTLLGRWRRA
ncbi:hypothetical protein [Streptomyces mirabilis]|uniref:hypothetical protein n=1 Tax=Streptomyces mirabilis TaxID=68239 RepID=UPI003720B5F6